MTTRPTTPSRGTAIYHTLRRGNSEHRVDNDLWLCVLDVATVRGWTPGEQPQAMAYARPVGMTVSALDARKLAESIEADLPTVSDEQVDLGDHAFGEEHTEDLLSRRAQGRPVGDEEVRAARELLSGAPKRDAEKLTVFMKGGAFSIDVG